MLLRVVLACLMVLMVQVSTTSHVGHAESSPITVYKVTIDGPISPAQDELLSDALAECEVQGCTLLLLVLDTPGGLGESMRSMVKSMLNSKVPVAVWVGPSGARAASAGVFLVAASSVAGMAPQTTIGAASPVGLGGKEISETMARKVTNDFSSLVKSVAESRGRNAAWYSESVEKAVSISSAEAVRMKVVELMADTPEQFLEKAGRAGILFKGETIRFSGDDISYVDHQPGFRYDFLSWLLHPQIAYLLLMGGMLGLFIEVTHPGTVFPGVFGGMCLLLGLYAMSVLPTNIAGVLLILFSAILFILEIKVVSFGMLTVAGAASLFAGSVILFRDEYGTIHIPLSYVVVPVLIVSSVIGFVLYLVTKAQRHAQLSGGSAMVGLVGEVQTWKGESGQILVRGEIWAAMGSRSEFAFSRGTKVQVVGINGLMLEIEPVPRKPLAHKG